MAAVKCGERWPSALLQACSVKKRSPASLFVAIQDEGEGPASAELPGKVSSNLPVPPEEHKLKDDDVVDAQVSLVALIFNTVPFLTNSYEFTVFNTVTAVQSPYWVRVLLFEVTGGSTIHSPTKSAAFEKSITGY